MDSKEFKLYVRKILLDNGFNEHSNPTCYIKDMGDYYLRSHIDKSTWSDSYGIEYAIYLKKFNDYNSIIKKIIRQTFMVILIARICMATGLV